MIDQSLLKLRSVDFFHQDESPGSCSYIVFPLSSSWTPENRSFAAYSLSVRNKNIAGKKNTDNSDMKVWGRFSIDTERVDVLKAKIRARCVPNDSLSSASRFPGRQALGHIKERVIAFGRSSLSIDSGEYAKIEMTLEEVMFQNLGVGVYDIIWQWEYKEVVGEGTDDFIYSEVWKAFEHSHHRIFIVADTPQAPWTPFPFKAMFEEDFEKTPLWTEALTLACSWAQGSSSINEACKKIADNLFSKGPFTYYSTSGFGEDAIPSEYHKLLGLHEEAKGEAIDEDGKIYFALSKVIDRIFNGSAITYSVNCTDCALIVIALSNILGAQLQFGKLQGTEIEIYTGADKEANRFDINPVCKIGSSTTTTRFNYHSIAWSAAEEGDNFGKESNLVFDACVRFGEDLDNSESAAGLHLGSVEVKESYLGKLAYTPEDGNQNCLPQRSSIKKIRIV